MDSRDIQAAADFKHEGGTFESHLGLFHHQSEVDEGFQLLPATPDSIPEVSEPVALAAMNQAQNDNLAVFEDQVAADVPADQDGIDDVPITMIPHAEWHQNINTMMAALPNVNELRITQGSDPSVAWIP